MRHRAVVKINQLVHVKHLEEGLACGKKFAYFYFWYC